MYFNGDTSFTITCTIPGGETTLEHERICCAIAYDTIKKQKYNFENITSKVDEVRHDDRVRCVKPQGRGRYRNAEG